VLTGYAPGALNQSLTVSTAALTAPICGLLSKMVAHTRADAVVLKTIGITTSALNAVAQRIRSVSTAKMRPMVVTKNGKISTQMTLLRKAVSIVSVEKTVL